VSDSVAVAVARPAGYLSFEAFVEAVAEINAGRASPADFDRSLATIGTTAMTTAILEAGRRSLDAQGRPFDIVYEGHGHMPTDIRPAVF
jgi:D-galacturonate reductase